MAMTFAQRLPSGFQQPGNRMLEGIKLALWLGLAALPALLLWLGWQDDTLGANPIETLQHETGSYAIWTLLLTLAITPLRRLSGLNWLMRLRRTVGLVSFVWASAHLAVWVVLDLAFDWRFIADDILDRPYITVGFVAFLLMLPLAVTSSNAMIRRLGGRRWQQLHRSVYAIGILAVIHVWWLVKSDLTEPIIYAVILSTLLGLRAWWRELERRRQQSAIPRASSCAGKPMRVIPLQVDGRKPPR